MRISLNWLQELVDISLSPAELAETLTKAGFEVEDIEDRRAWADGVVLGKIMTCTPHPNADKLRVCQVNIGQAALLNIVCGAPNARADILVPVATIGTYLPTIDLKIKPAKLRDVPSEGMICSLAELGLAKESAGIHIFDVPDPVLGSDIRPLLGLDDVILDVTATANRADALSMVGIAREVAALTGANLHLPTVPSLTVPTPAQHSLSVNITATDACPVYIGTVIKDVKISASPVWLQRRLEAAGIRPINNVVDVTNYILLEWGQPLHAFDRSRLASLGTNSSTINIGVRFAHPDESMKTLDDRDRPLYPQNLLITANDRPVAIAGVMGGGETEVYDGTTDLILEAAIFESPVIRKSGKSQGGLRTESSIRYERGVNQAELLTACDRAVQMICDLASGHVQERQIGGKIAEKADLTNTITLRLSRLNQILGQVKNSNGKLALADVEKILTALGCTVQSLTDDTIQVQVPPYRYRDLEREIDLIEEVARLYGLDNFVDTLPSQSVAGCLSPETQALRAVRSLFRAQGLTELMHYSLVKSELANQISLANPLFVEYSALRTETISGLIDAFVYNLQQGNGPLNGIETGKVFWKLEEKLQELNTLAGIMGGDRSTGRWVRGGQPQPLTWFEAKGILESVWEKLGLTVNYQPWGQEKIKPPKGQIIFPQDIFAETLHPGRTASLWLNGKYLGIFGQLHPQCRQQRELPDEVYVFQIDLGVLLEAICRGKISKFNAYSAFPASDRDIAFYIPLEHSVADLEKVIKTSAGDLLESVELFDEYRGESVPEGMRSLAFRLVYRQADRTLKDEDVEPLQQKIRNALVKKFAVTLRS